MSSHGRAGIAKTAGAFIRTLRYVLRAVRVVLSASTVLNLHYSAFVLLLSTLRRSVPYPLYRIRSFAQARAAYETCARVDVTSHI
jgi:hypothetical protein